MGGGQSSQRPSFGEQLRQAMSRTGPLCLGIDPHPHLLESWGLPATVQGLETFSLTVLEAALDARGGPGVAAVKPQIAFFERWGSAGFAVLEKVLARAREAQVLTIADAKRGDIGSTMAGYAHAWLAEGSALVADSVTLSPYLGFESLRPALDLAVRHGRGVFVLGLTSNPEGAQVQHRGAPAGDSVAKVIIESVGAENRRQLDSAPAGSAELVERSVRLGSVGVVLGATVAQTATDLGISLAQTHAPILAPGFGAQGAGPEQLRTGFGEAWPQVLVNSSRAILEHGPRVAQMRESIAKTLTELATV